MIKKILAVILVLLLVAVVVAVAAAALVLHDYEHSKRKCGNCAVRDDVLGFCWQRDLHVGTEDKACCSYVKRHQI